MMTRVRIQMSGSLQGPPQPKLWRVALGFLMAPLAPAALWLLPGLWHGTPLASLRSLVMLVAMVGGYPAVVLLGVPAYFLLRRRLRPRLITVALAGGLIAAAPWAAWLPLLPNPSDAWDSRCHRVIDGHTTLCGYVEDMQFIALVFGLGVIGGIAFWICAIWRDANLVGSPAARRADRQIQQAACRS
jgi:hypothetical protein